MIPPTDDDVTMGGAGPSSRPTSVSQLAHAGPGPSFGGIPMRPQKSVAVAQMLGVSPVVLSNPLAAKMSNPAVKDFLHQVGDNKVQDLAIASMASQDLNSRACLTAASLVKLDSAFRIEKHWVADNSHSTDGYIKTLRHDFDKRLFYLEKMMATMTDIFSQIGTDDHKAQLAETKANCEAEMKKMDDAFMEKRKRKGNDEEPNDFDANAVVADDEDME